MAFVEGFYFEQREDLKNNALFCEKMFFDKDFKHSIFPQVQLKRKTVS